MMMATSYFRSRVIDLGRNPELGREISTVAGEYSHSFVREGMDEIYTAKEEKRDTDNQKKTVRDHLAGIPDNDKNREGNRKTGKFNDTVKEEKIHRADEIKGNKDSCQRQNLQQTGRGNEHFYVFPHSRTFFCHLKTPCMSRYACVGRFAYKNFSNRSDISQKLLFFYRYAVQMSMAVKKEKITGENILHRFNETREILPNIYRWDWA
jgi:hypothetical protein